ncbi:hypothetical protein Pmani_028931 [Petrolisthes manimaculis]|uniref:Uncharacterized protein n=1 Tax=Petrolisthes manimaculis TaxID=1843537 RepID=A0AAE1NYK5_9EUCA|nr:hypothetical protein Pmani_028931 [Petrolisthes manimaculis]
MRNNQPTTFLLLLPLKFYLSSYKMGEDGGGVGGARRAQERENLRHIIQQWNANRLDLFEISEPNESKDTTSIPLLESPARECVQDMVIMDESTIPLHHDASQPAPVNVNE